MTDPNLPIDLVLHTPGGLVLASYQIAHAIKHRPGKVTVHVPHIAMSGGTLIALAADEIVMGDHAVLGPVDPQIGEYPAASLVKLLEAKPVADIDDRTWILADMGRKAMDQLRDHLKELLAEHFDPGRAEELARTMSEGRWTHDFPITFEEAQALGPRVAKGLDRELYQLMSLYPHPLKHQIRSIQVFGLLSASGILSALVIEMSFIPACRTLLPPPQQKEIAAEKHGGLLERVLESIARTVNRRPWLSLVLCGALLARAILSASRIGRELLPARNAQERQYRDRL